MKRRRIGVVRGVVSLVGLATVLASGPAAAATQDIELKRNWNLISFNVVPADPSPEAVFNAIGPNGTNTLTSVWTYDALSGEWSAYPAPSPEVPAITAIEAGRGYWVFVTQDTVQPLTVIGEDGQVPTAGQELRRGWNLVGFTITEEQPASAVLGTIPYSELFRWEPFGSGEFYEDDVQLLEPGRGYWIYADSRTVIAPFLGTAMPSDVDLPPLIGGAYIYGLPRAWPTKSPGDLDIGGDGYYDPPESQRALAFEKHLEFHKVSIFNDGTGVLRYAASVDDPAGTPWLSFRVTEPDLYGDGPQYLLTTVSGELTTTTDELEVVVTRHGLPPGDYGGSFTISSNGLGYDDAARSIEVHMSVAPLDGDYHLVAHIDTINGEPADLHNPRMYLSIFHDDAGLRAIADDERTLLLPRRMPMQGDVYEDATTSFILSGDFELPASHPQNPYNIAVRRDITLLGQRPGIDDTELDPLDIKGEYRETIRNLLDEPIYLAGTFVATHEAQTPTVLDQPLPGSAEPGSAIPDGGDATLSIISVTRDLIINHVEISLDITHPSPGDLYVTLEPPNGGPIIILRAYTEDPVGPRIYAVNAQPVTPLENLHGVRSVGDWTLRVGDNPAVPNGLGGTLNSWSLTLAGTDVHAVSGDIAGVAAGTHVQLTGCDVSRTTTTDASGAYAFDGLVDCIYQVTVVSDAVQNQSSAITVDGADATVATITPGPPDSTTTPPAIPVPGTPAGGGFSFPAATTLGGGGRHFADDLGAEAAINSATFDLNRAPRTAGIGAEDTDQFDSVSAVETGINAFLLNGNGSLDPPVGEEASHYQISLNVGQPLVGRAVAGSWVLNVGANPNAFALQGGAQ